MFPNVTIIVMMRLDIARILIRSSSSNPIDNMVTISLNDTIYEVIVIEGCARDLLAKFS